MVLDVDDRRILEVLLGADSGLDSVRMTGKQHRINSFHCLGVILRQAHVLLLIDRFQLGVEAADHGMDEPVSLDLGPIIDLVGGNILLIDGHISGCEGIGACRSDDGHQFVIFIGDGYLGRLIADRVYDMIQSHPLLGVDLGPIFLEKASDLLKHGLLGLIIRGSETLGALEHQVLKVMGQTCGLMRVVLASNSNRDVSLKARSLLINSHIHLEPIVQGIYFRIHRIAFDGLILVLRA